MVNIPENHIILPGIDMFPNGIEPFFREKGLFPGE
jgi:hypothetical protein